MPQLFCGLGGPRYPWQTPNAGSASAGLVTSADIPIHWQDGTNETLLKGTSGRTVSHVASFNMTTGASWVAVVYKGGQSSLVMVQESDIATLDTILTTLTGIAMPSWAIIGKVLNDGTVDIWQQG